MILINLLPPELRRTRGTGLSPVVLAMAGGLALVLLAGGMLFWLHGKVGAANSQLAAKTEEMAREKENSAQVDKLVADIAAAEKRHEILVGLFTRKVYWAKVIDDFANLLGEANNQEWTNDGYEVRCLNLSAGPASASSSGAKGRGAPKSGPVVVLSSWKAQFRIYGRERDRGGEYLKSFFETVEKSPFWSENGFVEKPDKDFKGYTPNWKPGIGRVTLDVSYDWRRAKVIAPVAGPEKPGKPAKPAKPAKAAK